MDYPWQIDLAWLAVDEDGRLGVMTTGGGGPIPAQVLSNNDDDIFGVEEALLRLPLIGTASVHVQVPDPMSFKALSERGLFVYDWSDVHRSLGSSVGAYELVASPSLGLGLVDLPIDLRRLAAPIEGCIGASTLKIA
jgi:hypothetical protein